MTVVDRKECRRAWRFAFFSVIEDAQQDELFSFTIGEVYDRIVRKIKKEYDQDLEKQRKWVSTLIQHFLLKRSMMIFITYSRKRHFIRQDDINFEKLKKLAKDLAKVKSIDDIFLQTDGGQKIENEEDVNFCFKKIQNLEQPLLNIEVRAKKVKEELEEQRSTGSRKKRRYSEVGKNNNNNHELSLNNSSNHESSLNSVTKENPVKKRRKIQNNSFHDDNSQAESNNRSEDQNLCTNNLSKEIKVKSEKCEFLEETETNSVRLVALKNTEQFNELKIYVKKQNECILEEMNQKHIDMKEFIQNLYQKEHLDLKIKNLQLGENVKTLTTEVSNLKEKMVFLEKSKSPTEENYGDIYHDVERAILKEVKDKEIAKLKKALQQTNELGRKQEEIIKKQKQELEKYRWSKSS